MTTLITPKNGKTINCITEIQRKYINDKEHSYNENKIDWAHLERMSTEDHTRPLKTEFCWKTDKESSIISISENFDFKNCRIFTTSGNSIQIDNFKVNTKYFWRVNDSEIFSFFTEDVAPRWINVAGLTNVRDAGNWKTKYGCRIKQGLLFRGSEMDRHHTITEEGKRVLCNDLKIHTDLDLRGEGLSLKESPMGHDTLLKIIPTAPYNLFMSDDLETRLTCKNIFEFLADENNYPIYYHCWGGADRTGTIAYILGAELGMYEEDLILDYELTSLAIWGDRSRKSDLYHNFLTELDKYDGNGIAEKIHSFLLSRDIDEFTLDKIRNILLEK